MASEHHHHPQQEPQGQKRQKSIWQTLSTFTAVIIIGIIGYYLITEHRAHVVSFFASFPWWILIFLLCPLMHFMHGKHGGHGDGHHHEDEKKNDISSEKKD